MYTHCAGLFYNEFYAYMLETMQYVYTYQVGVLWFILSNNKSLAAKHYPFDAADR